jgi:predicted dehydrogenase
VGHLGRHHARLLADMPDVELVAVVDKNPAVAAEIAALYRTRPLHSHAELIGNVDAVSIAAPTAVHFDIARDLIEAGVPILVEKPMTPDIESARALVALAKKKKVLLQVGHVERFNPALMAVQKIIKPPRFIESHRLSPYTFRSRDINVVLDLMIHDIDIILHLVKAPLKDVQATGFSVLSKSEDIANARLTFGDGCVANVTTSRISYNAMRKIRVFSDDSYVSLDYGARTAFIYRPNEAIVKRKFDVEEFLKKTDLSKVKDLRDVVFKELVSVEEIKMDEGEPLRLELESFVHSVRTGTPPVVSGEAGLRALEAAHLIVEKIRSHKWTDFQK